MVAQIIGIIFLRINHATLSPLVKNCPAVIVKEAIAWIIMCTIRCTAYLLGLVTANLGAGTGDITGKSKVFEIHIRLLIIFLHVIHLIP